MLAKFVIQRHFEQEPMPFSKYIHSFRKKYGAENIRRSERECLSCTVKAMTQASFSQNSSF